MTWVTTTTHMSKRGFTAKSNFLKKCSSTVNAAASRLLWSLMQRAASPPGARVIPFGWRDSMLTDTSENRAFPRPFALSSYRTLKSSTTMVSPTEKPYSSSPISAPWSIIFTATKNRSKASICGASQAVEKLTLHISCSTNSFFDL